MHTTLFIYSLPYAQSKIHGDMIIYLHIYTLLSFQWELKADYSNVLSSSILSLQQLSCETG